MLERKKPMRSGSSLSRGPGTRRKSGRQPQQTGVRTGGKPLKARTPLQTKKPPPKNGIPIPRGSTNKGRKPSKTPRPKTSAQERDCRELVSERSRGRCELCARQGVPLEKAHRVGRSQSGLWAPSNIIDLCSRCHAWNHAHPTVSYEAGWHLRQGADPLVEPVLLTRNVTPEHLCQPTTATGWDPRTLPLVMAVLDDAGSIRWLDEESCG